MATKTVAASAATAAQQQPSNLPTSAGNKLPASSIEAAFDTGDTGYENVTAKDLLIPRLTIIQGLSPQVTQGEPQFDPEARVGDVYDVGLGERFNGGIVFIPVYYSRQFLEWAPRASGKGLIAIHVDDKILAKTTKNDKGKDVLDNGNYIVETAQFFGLNVSAGFRRSFLPMASTQLKKARRLLTLATGEKLKRSDGSEYTPPLFYRAYALTTVPESNNEGKWMGWKVERGPALTEYSGWEGLLEEIKTFREQIASGTIRGDVAAMEDEVSKGGTVIDNDGPM